jgi:uncharacterized protein (DUF433 family)
VSAQAVIFRELRRQLPDFLEQRGDEEIYLQGHRITLEDVCFHYNEGCTAEMLRERFPTLPLVLVHKVIVFYLENHEAVDDYLTKCQAARDANFERWQNTPRTTPDAAQLRQRLQARQTAGGADQR